MKASGYAKRNPASLFPLAQVSRVPLRVGLEYGMKIQGTPLPGPDVPLPVLSSRAQMLNVFRHQLSRNIRLLRTYGFRPDYPTLKADSIPFTAKVTKQRPTPVLTNFGPPVGRVNSLATRVSPRVGRPGTMGSVKRFPKAVIVNPNTYKPPVYGGDAQKDTEP